MRTALLLLLLLALAAIPGSFVPQSGVDAQAVLAFAEEYPRLTPVFDALGLFDVYASPWFSAIYLLLMVSLIGCIIPRTLVYARAVRARPPRAPRTFAGSRVRVVRDRRGPRRRPRPAASVLRRQRYRVDVDPAAPTGRSRTWGSCGRARLPARGRQPGLPRQPVVALVSIAVGSLWGYQGSVIVVEGEGFSNTLTQYDEFSAGAMFEPEDLPPFSMLVYPIDVSFHTEGPTIGAPKLFRARGSVVEEPGGPAEPFDITVNHPLQVDNASVFLVGQGYAPVITVRDGQGEIVYSRAVPFLPEDPTYLSNGVVKIPDSDPQLGFEGFFVPSPRLLDDGAIVSASPTPVLPTLALFAYEGDLGLDDGTPQSVYSLDKERLARIADESGEPVRFDLLLGETYELPDGLGSITFDDVRNFGRFQIAHAPMKGVTLAAAVAGLLGLVTSLFLRPRRAWVRVRSTGGRTVVEVARLDRVSGADLGADVDDLVTAVRGTATREEAR
jgi:cytochrome c biogenesis protein